MSEFFRPPGWRRLATIALFGIMFLWALLLSPACERDHQATTAAQDANQDQAAGKAGAPPIAAEKTSGSRDQPPDQGDERSRGAKVMCDAFAGTTATDRIMVVVTLAYVLVNYWMLLAIQRQADVASSAAAAAQTSANEAKLSGERFVRLEQPWLTPLPGIPEPVSERETTYRFRVKLVNYGRTPAWVTSRRIHLVRVVNREVPPDEPRGFLSDAISRDEIVIAPKKKLVEYEVEDLSDTDKGDMMRGALTFLLHGEIEYRDTFNTAHHAGFAWFVVRWHPHLKREAPWSEGQWGFQRGPDRYWTSD